MKYQVIVKQEYLQQEDIEFLKDRADEVETKEEYLVFISYKEYDELSGYLRDKRITHKLDKHY